MVCTVKGIDTVPIHTYRKIFNTYLNISFHRPVKDQIALCNSFSNATGQLRVQMEVECNDHIRNSKLAQESKMYDKSRVLTDKDVTVACFDLEHVLLTPHGKSSVFFKRRLNTYNFAIYDYCYVWDENFAGRGACEVSSSLPHPKLLKLSQLKCDFYKNQP